MTKPEFPKPIRMSGRLHWRRSELEAYKQALIALATGATLGEAFLGGVESLRDSRASVQGVWRRPAHHRSPHRRPHDGGRLNHGLPNIEPGHAG